MQRDDSSPGLGGGGLRYEQKDAGYQRYLCRDSKIQIYLTSFAATPRGSLPEVSARSPNRNYPPASALSIRRAVWSNGRSSCRDNFVDQGSVSFDRKRRASAFRWQGWKSVGHFPRTAVTNSRQSRRRGFRPLPLPGRLRREFVTAVLGKW